MNEKDIVEVDGVQVFSAKWILGQMRPMGYQVDRANLKANIAIWLVVVRFLVDLIKALI